jgi:hypothetical protein
MEKQFIIKTWNTGRGRIPVCMRPDYKAIKYGLKLPLGLESGHISMNKQ